MIFQRISEKLPPKVKALCYETPDGDYVVLFNPLYDRTTLLKAYNHEVDHIDGGDFENRDTKTIDNIEASRHVDRED